jgi:hypothetical protein
MKKKMPGTTFKRVQKDGDNTNQPDTFSFEGLHQSFIFEI